MRSIISPPNSLFEIIQADNYAFREYPFTFVEKFSEDVQTHNNISTTADKEYSLSARVASFLSRREK